MKAPLAPFVDIGDSKVASEESANEVAELSEDDAKSPIGACVSIGDSEVEAADD